MYIYIYVYLGTTYPYFLLTIRKLMVQYIARRKFASGSQNVVIIGLEAV